MSDKEINSGTRWNEKVAKALEHTDFGIICVTAANQHNPWLMFEAGALAKRLGEDAGRVVPLCLDLEPADIIGPLEAFQGRRLDESGIRRLVQDMMILREQPLTPAQTDQLFEVMWPPFAAQVHETKEQFAAYQKHHPDPEEDRRSAEDMLRELVERVRRIEREYAPRAQQGFVSSEFGVRATDTATASDYTSSYREPIPLSEQ
jgi:hypothetical protein